MQYDTIICDPYLVGVYATRQSIVIHVFSELDKSIQKYLKYQDWYVWTNMETGKITLPIFQSLEAFWPGVQVST